MNKAIKIILITIAMIILGVSVVSACVRPTPEPTLEPTPTEQPKETPTATPSATTTPAPPPVVQEKDPPEKSDPCYWHKDEYGWDCDTKAEIFPGENPEQFGPNK